MVTPRKAAADKQKPGPKGKFTPARLNKIIKAIKEGSPHETAASFAGISVSTFYGWLEKGRNAKSGQHLDFYERVKQAEAHAEAERVRRINKAGREGDWKADAWYLERRYPEKWGRRVVSADLSHSGEVVNRHEYEEDDITERLEQDEEGRELLKQLFEWEQRQRS